MNYFWLIYHVIDLRYCFNFLRFPLVDYFINIAFPYLSHINHCEYRSNSAFQEAVFYKIMVLRNLGIIDIVFSEWNICYLSNMLIIVYLWSRFNILLLLNIYKMLILFNMYIIYVIFILLDILSILKIYNLYNIFNLTIYLN